MELSASKNLRMPDGGRVHDRDRRVRVPMGWVVISSSGTTMERTSETYEQAASFLWDTTCHQLIESEGWMTPWRMTI